MGASVVNAETQPHGFSPGVAARLFASNGQRVFVKAVCPELNPHTPKVHRRESIIVPALPRDAPVPRLLWSIDEGTDGWVALVFEDVDGRHPSQPWREDELDRVVSAMEELSVLLTPSPLPASIVGTARNELTPHFQCWRRIHDQQLAGFTSTDALSHHDLEMLIAIEDTLGDALEGKTLLHGDVRADNVLLTPQRAWFVDWPQAIVGPAWFDVVALAPSVTMQGGPSPEDVIIRHSEALNAEGESLTAAVVGLAGYFTYQALQPPPPGIPSVRAFQDAQGKVARRWAAERLGVI